MDFANFWKMDGPTESCSGYTVETTESCDDLVRLHFNQSGNFRFLEYLTNNNNKK